MTAQRIIRGACQAVLLALTAHITPAAVAAEAPSSRPAIEGAKSAIETSAISASSSITPEWIKSKISELESQKDIDPAVREQALTLYRNALGQIEAYDASVAGAAEFQGSIQTAPAETSEIKSKLAAVKASDAAAAPAPKKPVEQLNLDEAEQLLNETQAEIAKLKAGAGQLDVSLRTMVQRSTDARTEQLAEKQSLDQLGADAPAGTRGENAIVAEARNAAIMAERMARTAKINLLEQELISLPARQALASAKRDLASAMIETLEARVPRYEARIYALGQSTALKKQVEAEQATRQLSGDSPILEDYAKTTADLHQRLTDLMREIGDSQLELAVINAEATRVKESQAAAQQILDIGRVGEEFGAFLREMRAQLPAGAVYRKAIRDREEAIVDLRLKRLKVDADRRMLTDLNAAALRLQAEVLRNNPNRKPEELRPALDKLVASRREVLDRLSDELARRVRQLGEINAAQSELLSQAQQIGSLLNNRLLWLPGAAPVGTAWLQQIVVSLQWLGGLESAEDAATTLAKRAAEMPIVGAVVVCALALLMLFNRRLKARMAAIAGSVGRLTDGYLLTPEALLITAVRAAPWPLLLAGLSWLIVSSPQASEFAECVAQGLLWAALVTFFLRFLQLLSAKKGLFAAHFKWSARACRVLHQNLTWLMLVAIPAAYLLGVIDASKAQVHRDGLGRVVFLVAAVAVAAFAFRTASPRKGVFVERFSPDGALWLTRGAWHTLIWLAPLALAALALFGYYDAASELAARLLISAVIVTLGLVAYGVAMREVLVARRNIEIHRAYERREKAKASAAAKEAVEAAGDAVPAALEESEVDVASISMQTRSLLRLLVSIALAASLWFVWRQMLPALGVLDQVALWTQTVTTDAGTKIVPVTLSNALAGLALAVITLIAARNLPGVLEITLLQRLAIESGTRYAITAVSRYTIITIGLFAAFHTLGADWSQVQWIVAALGVGVGFGLQEIVANFISGLIILFERPVRVGDTVTIGDLSGTVSRIQIRATSITDWDNRETLVPNKSLITEKVTNWTLSDAVTRILLKVGIAYGSDTALAQRIMMDVVRSTPQVLDKPPPTVFFLGFGESSLDFEVRVFVAQPSHRLSVLHDLHVSIDQALRDHRIEIPFPQRDLHLRGVPDVTPQPPRRSPGKTTRGRAKEDVTP